MEQQKNLMLFTILSIFILTGWLWMQHQIWPPQPKKQDQEDPAITRKILSWEKLQSAVVSGLAGSHSPLASAFDPFALALDLDQYTTRYKAPPLPKGYWPELSADLKKTLVGVPVGPEILGQVAHLALWKEPPPPAQEDTQTVVLGGAKHHMQAILTTHGAGVQKLILNKFQAANWLGRPEKSELELIQDDPHLASFLLYHFPSAQAERPVLSLGEQNWKLESDVTGPDDVQEVRFSTHVPGQEHVRITKVYRLEPGTYHLGLSLEITDERDPKAATAEPTWFRYQMSGAHGLPIEGEWYTSTFRNAVVGVVDNRGNLYRDLEDAMRISHRAGGDRVPQGNLGESLLQYAGVMTQYFGSVLAVDDEQAKSEEGGVDPRKILAWARPTLETSEIRVRLSAISDNKKDIVCDTQAGMEVFTLLPRVTKHLQEVGLKNGDLAVVSYYELANGKKVATWIRPGHTARTVFDDITMRVHSQDLTLQPGQKIVHRFLLYHGPVKVKLLGDFTGERAVPAKYVNRYAYTLNLRSLTDYGKFLWWTDLIVVCTNLMHWLLNILRFFGNGLSVILLTVLVRGLMFPISRKQAIFSVKMQELAPEMKKLQEKYKNDARAKTEATMELYRKHNVHPLGGCLPIFMQMPIFIGLYFALQESIHFRLAPFLWIPNLAAPDMLIYWTESISWISDPDSQGSFLYLGPYLNLLPIIAVTLMIVQQKVMTPPPQDEQQEMQFKMMRYMMVFMGLMFYKVAAGLCIYFTASSLWGLAERRFLPKKKTAVAVVSPSGPSSQRPGPSGRKPPGKTPEKKEGQMKKVSDWWQELLKQARKK